MNSFSHNLLDHIAELMKDFEPAGRTDRGVEILPGSSAHELRIAIYCRINEKSYPLSDFAPEAASVLAQLAEYDFYRVSSCIGPVGYLFVVESGWDFKMDDMDDWGPRFTAQAMINQNQLLMILNSIVWRAYREATLPQLRGDAAEREAVDDEDDHYTMAKPGAAHPKRRKVILKVHTAEGELSESIWATEVHGDVVKIANLPFLTDFVSLNDLVRVNPSGELVQVLERFTRNRHGTYQPDSDRVRAVQQWHAIYDYLGSHVLGCESAGPGLLAMAVPKDLSDDDLREICAQCPVPITLSPANGK